MKITRYKRAQRNLTFYRNNFNFRPPYQILLDGTFCQAALRNQVNISEQMPKYLNDQVKLLTTVCVVDETEKLSSSIYGTMLIVKKFPVHKCGHEKNPVSANECLYSLLERSKDEHYFLATQDPDLTQRVRQLVHVPIIYLKLKTIVMEKPQELAKSEALRLQQESLRLDNHQFQTLKQLKKIEFGEKERTSRKRKHKGPKGPNPLSCKKKKTMPEKKKTDESQEISKKRRKRSKRIPNHIKRMFQKIESDMSVGN